MRLCSTCVYLLTAAGAITGCGSADSEGSGDAGSTGIELGTGGANANGGSPAGGDPTPGGVGGGGPFGGSPGLGGLDGVGGNLALGGWIGAGGSVGAGGSSSVGGSPVLGGAFGSGGVDAVGGSVAAGGSVGSGGSIASGGTVAAGGTVAVGGSDSGGGTDAGGGAVGVGGAAGIGGSAGTAGWAGSGGDSGSGGAVGTGGGTATCGTYSWACWPMPNPPGSGLPHPASYTDNGDGTVQDDVTGLIWQQDVTGSYTWSDAITYCEELALAGFDDWRLPKRIELLSIVDHTRTGPAANTSVLPTPAAYFWTSTPWAVSADPPRAWIVNFYEGLTSNNGYTTGEYNARCVRGGPDDGSASPDPPPNLYSEIAPGEIQDRWTGLIWTQETSPASMSYADAEAYCAGLDLNGNGWRLPSVNELSTLVDERTVAPAIDTATFPDTAPNHYYWSQTQWAGSDPDLPWGLNYNDGYSGHGRDDLLVRCVR